MKNVKVTRFDKILMLVISYAGLGIGIYSLIRKSSYSNELLQPMISLILWIVLVVAVNHAIIKHQNKDKND